MSELTAGDVLTALRLHHGGAAILTEVVVSDGDVISARRDFHTKARQGYLDEPLPDLESDYWQPFTRRIDALMVLRNQRTAIEIKVSRADYRRETEQKRRTWQAITHRFVYAVPAGLVAPSEVPDGLGLWWVHEGRSRRETVEVVKRARVNRDALPLPEQVVHALCYRAARIGGAA